MAECLLPPSLLSVFGSNKFYRNIFCDINQSESSPALISSFFARGWQVLPNIELSIKMIFCRLTFEIHHIWFLGKQHTDTLTKKYFFKFFKFKLTFFYIGKLKKILLSNPNSFHLAPCKDCPDVLQHKIVEDFHTLIPHSFAKIICEIIEGLISFNFSQS